MQLFKEPGPHVHFLSFFALFEFISLQGLYFGPKTIFVPHPSEKKKMIFFPLSRHVVFRLPSWPFCLNSSLFCIFLNPFTSLFLTFFSLSSFFFYIFPLFLFAFSYFSPQMTSADSIYIPIYRVLFHCSSKFPLSCVFLPLSQNFTYLLPRGEGRSSEYSLPSFSILFLVISSVSSFVSVMKLR
jgi:hypothetical protein